MDRYASVQRQTQETAISVEICLDSGERDISTGIGFLIICCPPLLSTEDLV